jgi:hypothetical protein
VGNLGDGLEVFYEVRARFASAPVSPPRDHLQEGAARYRARELLLVRVQNMLWPAERGGPGHTRWRAGPVNGLTDDADVWAQELLRRSDFAPLADDCGLDIDGLASLYDELAWQALDVDPNARLSTCSTRSAVATASAWSVPRGLPSTTTTPPESSGPGTTSPSVTASGSPTSTRSEG